MALQVSYPGVYIDEFTPAAPIQGAGTSTAAFVGINGIGEPNKPVLITNWEAFVTQFTDGNSPADDDYLYYAVRGFFLNGGKVCFVTAVSNGKVASAVLGDASTPTAKDTIKVKVRRGLSGAGVTVVAAAAHAVSAARLFKPEEILVKLFPATNATGVDLGDPLKAVKFLAGERVVVTKGTVKDPYTVVRVTGSVVLLSPAPKSTYDATYKLRLADLPASAKAFRVNDAAALVPGSIVTLSQSGATSITTVVESVSAQPISAVLTTYLVSVKEAINGFALYSSNAINLQSEEFSLSVSGQAQPYNLLSMNPGHPRYYADVINNDVAGTVLAEPVTTNHTALPANRPKGSVTLVGGTSHDPDVVRNSPMVYYPEGFAALESVADVNIVAVDSTDTAVQVALRDHCTNLAERFGILDAQKGTALQNIDTQRASLENDKGFTALYYPWIEVASLKTGRRILVPPSGYVAGVYARTDNGRGVHKAPAGTEATLSGALGVEQMFSDADQGVVNLKGINVIRVFQHGGAPVVWGARTTSQNTNWQYVNIRRLFIFLEESIQVGIRGSVFEPNNTGLWQKLKRTIGAFLTQQWRDGALFGNKPEEAFYVRIDEVLNPDSQRALGRLTLEIGVRPSYPAEFIVVRIGIWQGGSSVSEA